MPDTNPIPSSAEFLESIQRLTRDLKNASITLSDREARFLVDAYYAMQRDRIRAAHQNRTLTANSEPHDILLWLELQRSTLERQIAGALDVYSNGLVIGRWARSQIGIGPIIAAGLAANIDVKQCPTVGHIWRFAGLDPTVQWKAGVKRPWNASLKRLCFLIGESFVKVSGNENAVYGLAYATRKQRETAKNEAGDYADQAARALVEKKWRDDTQAKKHYENGKLPPARIHMRAKRWAVKLFLSSYHHVLWESTHGEPPPKPYILAKDPELHTHFVAPPNWPMPAASLESTDDPERAESSESTEKSERVAIHESTRKSERAESSESTARTERAEPSESTVKSERSRGSRGRRQARASQ